MEHTGMITFTDDARIEKDVFYHDVLSLNAMAEFCDQIAKWTHASLTYYAYTQGEYRNFAPADEGEFSGVGQFLKICMRNLNTGDSFYDYLPAPVSLILETQRGGKRMIQDIGTLYAEYVAALKGVPVQFKYAYLIGQKY